jgi:hypothetical protein
MHEIDPAQLLYESTKQGPGGNSPQILTPLQFLDRLAALVPPPRVQRHRYFGVLARMAAHGKFQRLPGPSGLGRYGKLSITAIMERCFLWKVPQGERAPLLGQLAAAAPLSFA